MKIEKEVIEILEQCVINGNKLYLPPTQLVRKLYMAVNKVIELAGGKWKRSAKAHIFEKSIEDAIDNIVLTGEICDIKKELQFFETPPSVIDFMIGKAKIRPNSQVLEPSAGKGAIAKKLLGLRKNLSVDTCEVHEPFRQTLITMGCRVFMGDFLKFEFGGGYSHIIANPPFTRQQDISHVSHMLDHLVSDGTLVSVMSTGITFRTNRKTQELINRLDEQCSWQIYTLPEKSFKKSGTNIDTVLLVATRNAEHI